MSSPTAYSNLEKEETEYLLEDEFSEEVAEEEEFMDEYLRKYQTVQEDIFEELRMPLDIAKVLKKAWADFIGTLGFESAADVIYSACFDAAPTLQGLFKTPRSFMSLRLMQGITNIINLSENPPAMKAAVETLGSRHFDRDPQAVRVTVLQEAMVSAVQEVFPLSPKARLALVAVLNYIGGGNCYITREYYGRIKIISNSWKIANNKVLGLEDAESEEWEAQDAPASSTPSTEATDQELKTKSQKAVKHAKSSESSLTMSSRPSEVKVPTSFKEMFSFNSAVMGFGRHSTWMHLILDQFDDIVVHAADSYRLQEECDILSLVLAQHAGTMNLTEFKAIMLASLRSLLPKDWDSNHEVAWNWLWENVEQILRNQLGKPVPYRKALGRFIGSLSEDQTQTLRQNLFQRFFLDAPAAQDFFKQSATRLNFIADKIIEMTSEIFADPRQMVVNISALGLRHVAYEVPMELFSPLVSAGVEVMREMTTDDQAAEAFRWSLTLISKVLIRSVLDGSTIVMKAINTNQEAALRKAVALAPRGERAQQLLEVRVGTQSISPLLWAIESYALEAAEAMLKDLLTIRADREKYYYGCDALFQRHPEILRKLTVEAPTMLQPLLDGLLWRSRLSVKGMRRVNYYIKHLMQDEDGGFNKAMHWLADYNDPQVINHQVVALFSDIIWSGLARHYFLLGRLYFLFTMCVFAAGHALLPEEAHIAIFACRCYTYLGSMGHLLLRQMHQILHDSRHGKFEKLWRIPLPEHLFRGQELGSYVLLGLLILMCIYEPFWWCMGEGGEGVEFFTADCPAAASVNVTYGYLSSAAMLGYCFLSLDISVLSMRLNAFVIVCSRMLDELLLFLAATGFFAVSFALSIASLHGSRGSGGSAGFDNLGLALSRLLALALGFEGQRVSLGPGDGDASSIGSAIAIAAFAIVVIIFLANLLVAQLTQAYQKAYPVMQGYARLNRAKIIVATVRHVSQTTWSRFLERLDLGKRLEFNEGDVGFAGGLQVLEPASAHPTTVDSIRRYGGSTLPSMPWPEEEEEEDRLERLEKVLLRLEKRPASKRNRSGMTSVGSESSSESERASA